MIPTLDVGLVDAVRGGRVRVVSALQRFAYGEAVLVDGSRLQVDAVIAATGYRPALDARVGHLGVLDERGEPLIHAAQEPRDARGLHFVGYQVTLGGTFRLIGIETKQLARAVAASRRHEAVVSRAVSAQCSPAP